MKNLLNRKFVALLALFATFVLPVIAFAADEEPTAEAVAAGDGSGWIVVGLMVIVFFVLCISFLAFGAGLSAAMIGYKLGKEDE